MVDAPGICWEQFVDFFIAAMQVRNKIAKYSVYK
jgi:hypothetical protein